ncbi:MAG: prepilin-type N-terminal cleavage/methylation domain-containing protein [Aquabacterium sp.]|jgi:general secretion pathway protein J|nr:MAG: prepilin-type N-terminal cleavage/methylation domain-containing protein [Aquabacterium sp.]TAL18006.1 MAG: prepilin-type N-terminal cleavage/methylation domain-containing protein [Aquabacterium sp.]
MRPTVRRGFTLIEVLIALLIMSLIAVMAWQGVDAMVRTREVAQTRLTATLRLQTVASQLDSDLAELIDTQMVDALRFDGASLRLTRRSPNGVQLVVWSLRSGVWQRWASPPYTGSTDLREAWMRSLQFLGNEPGQLRAMEGVAGWQVYFFRGGAWTNSQSSATLVNAPAAASAASVPGQPSPQATIQRQVLPSGVRVVLTLAEGSGWTGTLTRDFLVATQ